MSRQISPKGLSLLQTYEGCKLTPYLDQRGVITIGYGHTGPEVNWSLHYTPDDALTVLKKDLNFAEVEVDKNITVALNDNEFSALVCFSYNVGCKAFHLSTLRTLLNQNKKSLAGDEFLKWIHVNGEVSQGLLNRRIAERALFLEPVS